ncbi:hypothetical protein TNCV_5063201 [Trichonephila clavipes]|nr:hypothetical protein TNCV_5063201 [Trichonephila clavipes]
MTLGDVSAAVGRVRPSQGASSYHPPVKSRQDMSAKHIVWVSLNVLKNVQLVSLAPNRIALRLESKVRQKTSVSSSELILSV